MDLGPFFDDPSTVQGQERNALPHGRPHTNPTPERVDRLCVRNCPRPASLIRALGWYVSSAAYQETELENEGAGRLRSISAIR